MSDISVKPVQPGDLPAGDAGAQENGVRGALISYGVGLALASGLSVASFLLPLTGLVYAPALPVALIVMAIAQMGVHLVFFLHITTGPDNTNNVLALAFGILMVFFLLTGTLWIMAHMNRHMSSMTPIMQMRPE